MIYAEKGNRVKPIKDSEIQQYIEQGYVILNAAGQVIKDTAPADIATLKKHYLESSKKIEQLEAQIAEVIGKNKILADENKALLAQIEEFKSAQSSVDAPESEQQPEVQVKKRATRTKKSEQ